MSNITYRPARQSESRIIGAFFREAAEGVADYTWSTLAEDGEDLLDVAERRFARSGTAFSYERTIVAVENGQVIGAALGFPLHVDPDEQPCNDPVLAPYAALEVDNSYYLACFLIRKARRNRGIGTGLMAAFEDKARSEGYSQTSLIVFAQNVAGVRLYHRMGFEQVDRAEIVPHPMIHTTGDALLFRKNLMAA